MSVLGSGLADKPWTSFQVRNNRYFHNVTDGFRKYDGTTFSTPVRATEYSQAMTAVTNGTGYLTVPGTYKIALTYYNPELGIESEYGFNATDRIKSQLINTGSAILATHTGSIPSPYTHIKIYRSILGGTDLFYESTFLPTTPTSGFTLTWGAAPDTALGEALDTGRDLIDIPKGDIVFEYRSHAFVLSQGTIRFSHVSMVDADGYWINPDRFEISTDSGSLRAGGVVGDTALCFTPTAIFGITGSSSADFTFQQLKKGIGCVSHNTISFDINGNMILFAGKQGVIRIKENSIVAVSQTGQIIDVESLSGDLQPVFNGTDDLIKLNTNDYKNSTGYVDIDENIYHLFVSDYHFILDLSTGEWGVEDNKKVKNSRYVKTSNESSGAYTCDSEYGFLVREDISYSDLVPYGTVQGNPTSSTRTTLTDTGASFSTIGSGIKGAYIVIDHDTFLEARQIASNTATSITVDIPWEVNPSTDTNYYIGYIQCSLLSKQYQLGEEVIDKSRSITFGLLHDISDETQQVILKGFIDKKEYPIDSNLIDLSNKIYDEVGLPGRGRFIQIYMFSQYNKKTSREGTPININNYIFLIKQKGKI